MRDKLMKWGPRVAAFLCLVAAASCTDQGSETKPEQEFGDDDADSPTLRARAEDEWYNDKPSELTKRGGAWPAEYRRFMLDAAAKERAKYPDLQGKPKLPVTPDTLLPASGTTWMSLGPTRDDYIKNGSTTLTQIDSGRLNSIVVDPNNASRIFLATAAGGVWRTTDGGTTWIPLSKSLGTLATGALAMDPNNSNTLYLGLGDSFDGTGIGLIKTTDGGDTWSAPVYLGSSTMTPALIVAPTNSNIVLAGTNAGLFRSTDAGATWATVSIATGQSFAPYIWSIAWTGGQSFALTLEANHAATTGTTDGQAWYSSDNGATWTRSTGFTKTAGIGRATVASAPSSRSTLYAMAAIPNSTATADLADFFKSTNGGQTWTALGVTSKKYTNVKTSSVGSILNAQGWYNQLVVVHPTNPSIAYFGGALLLAKTADGGSTYTVMTDWLAQSGLPYVHADFHAGSFTSTGAFYVGTDGGLFKSTDAGTTWSSALNAGLVTHLAYSVGSSLASTPAVIGGLQDNGTRLRSGSTSTFNQVIGGDGFGSDINRANASLMLGSLYYARIQKSTNGGSTWTQSCSGITECGASTAPFYTKIVPWAGDTTGNTLYTFSNAKGYKSTNYAGTWTALGVTGLPTTSFNIRNFGVAQSNQSVLGIVANSGRVFLSNNAGSSWTQAAAPPNNGLSMSYISFDQTNPNVVYVASVAPDGTKNHLWRSADFGASWTTIDGGGFPFGVPVNTIRTDPGDNTVLYAGTHLGVYRSTDSGATWTRWGNGMPLVSVSDIYISPDSVLVRAATYGRGFWELAP
jgi:photosystem II stability/assembly factor-like uncharacterized protein